jgi:hypothetical protein
MNKFSFIVYLHHIIGRIKSNIKLKLHNNTQLSDLTCIQEL